VNPYASPNAYQESAVLTASPGQLVVLLYDGAVRFLRQADAAMGEQALTHSHDRLSRAEAIVDELLATLDLEQGGEVARNLQGIYVFWKKCLWEVRLNRDREKLGRVIQMVASMRDAWAQIAQSA
jgi:flagellar protein FliS